MARSENGRSRKTAETAKAKTKTKRVEKFSKREIDEAEEEYKMVKEFSNFNKVRLTEKQQELYVGMENAIITTVTGPPGTSKSFTTLYQAVKQLQKGQFKKIILVKPLETSGEEVGILPGELKDKIAPYLNSFMDNLKEMMDGQTLKMLFDTGVIEFAPLAYMRGRTFKDCFIILEEMQNSDVKQLMTAVTRLGQNSKIVIIGDSNQNDIAQRYVALDYFIERILGEDENIFHFKFKRDDIVRHPLLIKITDNYEKAKMEGTLPDTKRKN